MLIPDRRAGFPSPPLAGDDWAQRHPKEHAQKVVVAQAKVAAALKRLGTGNYVTLGELDPRTTRDYLNEWDKIFRELDKE